MNREMLGTKNLCIEHALVVTNILSQLEKVRFEKGYYVFSNNVTYEFDGEIVCPDVSIVHTVNKRHEFYLTETPLVVMDVISTVNEECVRNEKMELYRKAGVSECWIIDWRKRQVEIYLIDGTEDGGTKPCLHSVITEENKDELYIAMLREKILYDKVFQME